MHSRVRPHCIKSLGLLAILSLHLAVLVWQRPMRRESVQAQPTNPLFLLASAAMRKQLVSAVPPPVTSNKPVQKKTTSASLPLTTLVAIPPPQSREDAAATSASSASTIEPDRAEAVTTPPATTLLDNARKLAGGVDKQLRKERLNEARIEQGHGLARDSKLANDIAAAYREKTFKMTDTRMENGDMMTKVRTSLGSYCVRTNSNRPWGARDPFKDTGKQTIAQCPH